jgi:hypothetical protein
MMFWLFRATQVTSLTYRLLLATMMTVYLIREGLSNSQKNKLPQLPAPKDFP